MRQVPTARVSSTSNHMEINHMKILSCVGSVQIAVVPNGIYPNGMYYEGQDEIRNNKISSVLSVHDIRYIS